MRTELTVITPVFNGVRFIEDCIKNVADQNWPQMEHLIIDGGSTDGTVDVIRRYAQRYRHIRWLSAKDKGQSDAMNKGVAMASGTVLGFLNVDDFYEPRALQEVMTLFADLVEPSLLVGNCNVWDNDGNLWFVSRPNQISLANLLLGKFIEAFPMNSSAYFYHRSLHEKIGPYKTDEHYVLDVDFIIRAVQHGSFSYHDATWGNYRYQKGTKTYRDEETGGHGVRLRDLIRHYRSLQPLPYRIYLALLELWQNWLTKPSLFRGAA